jgi:hypothetical protein
MTRAKEWAVASHFACIGLALRDPGELQTLLQELGSQFVEESRHGSEQHRRWTDASGASLAIHVEEGKVVCVTPFFSPPGGLSRWRISTSSPRDDGACAHCGGADCDVVHNGETVTRSTMQWLHYTPYRTWLSASRTYDVEVVAFARRVDLFFDDDAFSKARLPGLGDMKLLPNAFVPTGMFLQGADMGSAATAAIVGRIVYAEALNNSHGGAFWRLRLETLPGQLDVVAPGDSLTKAPKAGTIAFVDAWLVCRPTEPPQRAGWLRRLLGLS